MRLLRALSILIALAFVLISADAVREMRQPVASHMAAIDAFTSVAVDGSEQTPPSDTTLGESPARTGVAGAPTTRRIYPLGWYDGLTNVHHLPEISREGLDASMPYYTPKGDPHTYLAQADASHVRVLLEIPRYLVRNGETSGVMSYVSSYKDDPGVLGWYLADEPSMNRALGPLSPTHAKSLYDAIKRTDPVHPVAMAFGAGEDPKPYRSAMDVMMFFDYPCKLHHGEFRGLADWTMQMDKARSIVGDKVGFVPILQGFGRPAGSSFNGNRLPTSAEMRYMVFSSVQMRSLGLFFWTLYRSDPAWISETLEPIVSILNDMGPAVARGETSHDVSTSSGRVRVTSFTDGSATYIVAVHRGDGTIEAPLQLHGSVADATIATLLSEGGSTVPVSKGTIDASLDPYGVAVYRIA